VGRIWRLTDTARARDARFSAHNTCAPHKAYHRKLSCGWPYCNGLYEMRKIANTCHPIATTDPNNNAVNLPRALPRLLGDIPFPCAHHLAHLGGVEIIGRIKRVV